MERVDILLPPAHGVEYVIGDGVDGVDPVGVNLVVVFEGGGQLLPGVLVLQAALVKAWVPVKSGSCSRSMSGTSKAFLALTFYRQAASTFLDSSRCTASQIVSRSLF